jgi:hypothetical protein
MPEHVQEICSSHQQVAYLLRCAIVEFNIKPDNLFYIISNYSCPDVRICKVDFMPLAGLP